MAKASSKQAAPRAEKSNAAKRGTKKTAAKPAAAKSTTAKPRAAAKAGSAEKPVKLLTGGNPQIAKGYGDSPVQAYIAAMPGWKRAVGEQIDRVVSKVVPKVYKAVKWNSPFYGFEGQGWFLGVHCVAKYVKVAFFRGMSLRPLPPVESKQKEVRYFHIFENQPFDEAQFADWVKQAARLPMVKM